MAMVQLPPHPHRRSAESLRSSRSGPPHEENVLPLNPTSQTRDVGHPLLRQDDETGHPPRGGNNVGSSAAQSTGGHWLYRLVHVQGCDHGRRPEVVSIPSGYVGWVRINYGVNGEPPLQVQRRAYQIVVPQSGRIATSSPMTSGLAHDEYYYVDERGQRKLLKVAPAVDSPDGNIRATHYFTIP